MNNFKKFIKINDLHLDLLGRRLFFTNKLIYLRNKEFELIKYLISNPGKVLSRTQILEDVWDRNIFCTTNTVDVHISSLRRKLKSIDNRNIIRTVHCIGYMLDL